MTRDPQIDHCEAAISLSVNWEYLVHPRERRGGSFLLYASTRSLDCDQSLPLFSHLSSASSATSQAGEEAWELTSAGRASATRILPPGLAQPRSRVGGFGGRRSRVTELGSRGLPRGRAPAERAPRPVSKRSAAGMGSPWTRAGPAHLKTLAWRRLLRRRRQRGRRQRRPLTSSLIPSLGAPAPPSTSTANRRAPWKVSGPLGGFLAPDWLV